MTAANNDPEVFLTQVNDAIEKVNDAIGQFIENSANFINDNLTTGGGLLGGIVGGIPGAIVGSFVGHELEDRFNDAIDDINEKWEQASKTIREAIGSILGDPLQMSTIASRYRDCVEALGQVNNEITAANAYVFKSFSGDAATAYENTAGFQLAAAKGMAECFTDAADLFDDLEMTLLKYWTSQLKNLVDLAAAILGEAAELGDVGNWFTGGAGVVAKMIVQAGSEAATIVKDAADYWIDLNVGAAGDFDGLQSKIPGRGLENDLWPEFTQVDSGNLNAPWK